MTPAPSLSSPGARTAQFVAMCCALALPTMATMGYLVLLAGRPAMGAAYAASKAMQFAFPVLWVVFFQRRSIRVARPSRLGLGAGAVFGLVVLAAMLALYYGWLRTSPTLAGAPKTVADQMSDYGVDSLAGFLLLAGFLSLVHSLAEEYYWRWFVFGQLRQSMPLAAAIAISSLGFMSHHVLVIGKFLGGYGGYTCFFSVCVATGGASWAWLYHRTGTLYGAWLSHFLVDAGLMWIGYDLWTGFPS